jgi:hypothetical protein
MTPATIKSELTTSFGESFSIFLRKMYVKSSMNSSSVCRTGATTLVFSGNKLSMPKCVEDVSESTPLLHEELLTKLNPNQNDVIIVGSGETREQAEMGAKMAAIKLLKSNN